MLMAPGQGQDAQKQALPPRKRLGALAKAMLILSAIGIGFFLVLVFSRGLLSLGDWKPVIRLEVEHSGFIEFRETK